MMIIDIKALLKDWFNFPKNKLFCQVSTVSNGQPHIRTMDLYDLTNDGSLVFLTKTNSRKWNDLANQKNISVCMINLEMGQIIAEGSALLQTTENNPSMTKHYWENYLPQYWQNFYLSHVTNNTHPSSEIPSTFGVIQMIPHAWEFLEINTKDFLKGSRKKLQLKEGSWELIDLPVE